MSPIYVGSEIYRHSSYGAGHPLAVPRVSVCTDLIAALGWLQPDQYREAPMAGMAALARFHDPAYLQALWQAEQDQHADEATRCAYGIGAANNPVYPELFRRPATSAGGMLLGASLALEGAAVHCPGGGTHHGRAARASGFCYLNDCVLALLAWLDAGLQRVAYLDLDAHHGDGVQDAFAGDPRVRMVSLHEAGRWPHSVGAEDRAGGSARNLPLPRGCNDSEFAFALNQVALPALRAFAPQALLVQCGADALADDPLTRLDLSNGALWAAVAAVRDIAPCLLVSGGGGYNPYSTGRCWAGVWGVLCGHAVPPILPAAAQAVLAGLHYPRAAGRNPPTRWLTTLADPPNEGAIRPEVRALAAIGRGLA